jgi:hypothetical protein
MPRRILFGFLIVLFALSSVKADVMPPPGRRDPDPPAPAGPDKAVIRGVTVEQGFTYWRGRRWMTIVNDCAASQSGCKGKKLKGCFVTAADDRSLSGGDIAQLTAMEKSAGEASMKLKLENCELSEIELGR